MNTCRRTASGTAIRIIAALLTVVAFVFISCGGSGGSSGSSASSGSSGASGGSAAATPAPTGNGGIGGNSAAAEFLFASGPNVNSIGVWQIDPAAGGLTQVSGSPFPAVGGQLQGMAVHPSGAFLYTANAPTTSDPGGITAYSISSAGALAAIGPEVADAQQGGAALRITVDSAGTHAYVAGSIAIGAASYTIEPNSGTLTPLNPQPFDFQDHHGTEDLAIVNQTVYLTSAVGIDSQTINTDGSLSTTAIGVARTTVLMDRLVVSGNKFLYATTVIVPPPGNPFAGPEAGHIYGWTVNGDGSLSPIASTPVALSGVAGTAVSANLLFAGSPAGVSVYAVDSSTGALSQIPGSPFSGSGQLGDLAVDHSGKFLYALNGNQIVGFAIGSGGALSPVRGSPFSTGGLQPSVLVSTP